MHLLPLNRKVTVGLLALAIVIFAMVIARMPRSASAQVATDPPTLEVTPPYSVEFKYNSPNDDSKRLKKVLDNHKQKIAAHVTMQGNVLMHKPKFGKMTTEAVTESDSAAKSPQPDTISKVQQIEGIIGFQDEDEMKAFMAELSGSAKGE
ncbi:MAG: hypothetical protein M3Y80_05275 [Verrucomicrobiota bacterium]|nr:hypothetical protein [Verrucomicrobiota bacterium]